MPHFVIEYSPSLEVEMEPAAMLAAANDVAVASGQFGPDDIKVRLVPVQHALVAGQEAAFVHVSIYLLSGRDEPTKKAMTTAMVEALAPHVPSAASISANAIDMDRATYSKIAR